VGFGREGKKFEEPQRSKYIFKPLFLYLILCRLSEAKRGEDGVFVRKHECEPPVVCHSFRMASCTHVQRDVTWVLSLEPHTTKMLSAFHPIIPPKIRGPMYALPNQPTNRESTKTFSPPALDYTFVFFLLNSNIFRRHSPRGIVADKFLYQHRLFLVPADSSPRLERRAVSLAGSRLPFPDILHRAMTFIYLSIPLFFSIDNQYLFSFFFRLRLSCFLDCFWFLEWKICQNLFCFIPRKKEKNIQLYISYFCFNLIPMHLDSGFFFSLQVFETLVAYSWSISFGLVCGSFFFLKS